MSVAASKDNTLFQSSTGSLSNGAGIYLFAGKTKDGDLRRALLAFDLSSIPASAKITNVTLTLWSSKSSEPNTPVNFSLRKVTRNWGEGASDAGDPGGAGAPAQSGDATWRHTFYNTAMWTNPGGDFVATNSATTAVDAEQRAYSWSGSGMIADVQSWVDNPDDNFGWVLVATNEGPEETAQRFNSRENGFNPPKLTVTYEFPAQLLNISTRLRVETGDNALIGGFIITGQEGKKIILRAIGPSLQDQGVSDVLANPKLELRGSGGELIAQNQDWKDTQQTAIENTGIPPENDLEAAIVVTLQPGSYTAIVRGNNDTTGVGLVEAYDLAQESNAQLANISTRALVQSGSNGMVGGFIAGGPSGNTKVILRAIGPSLTQDGVANALPNPTLKFFNADGLLIEENDDWKNGPDQAELAAIGIGPRHDLESALIATIPPGSYTAQVAEKNGETGIGVVEVYNIR